MKGTPQYLQLAIRNGLAAAAEKGFSANDPEALGMVEAHVRDFLAQRFNVAGFQAGPHAEAIVHALWAMIIRKPEAVVGDQDRALMKEGA